MTCQLKNNLIISYVSIHLKTNTPAFFAPGETFLMLLSCDISVGKENLAQLFAESCYFLCVTTPEYSLSYWRPLQPVLFPSDVFTTLSKMSSSLTLPRKLLPSASQQSVTSTSKSNSSTVCSEVYKLNPVCSLISSSHRCLELTFFSLWGHGDDI